MIYYRVALQLNQSSTWQWKSTVLTSLDGLFKFLRLYGRVPKDHLRVFFSSSVDCLAVMLKRENEGLTSNSVTAEQFLSGMRINKGEMTHIESELGAQDKKGRGATAVTTAPSLNERNAVDTPAQEKCMSSLDMRRLELELRPVGDHDIPYTFSLPRSLPQMLAWTKLLAKVQAGELEP